MSDKRVLIYVAGVGCVAAAGLLAPRLGGLFAMLGDWWSSLKLFRYESTAAACCVCGDKLELDGGPVSCCTLPEGVLCAKSHLVCVSCISSHAAHMVGQLRLRAVGGGNLGDAAKRPTLSCPWKGDLLARGQVQGCASEPYDLLELCAVLGLRHGVSVDADGGLTPQQRLAAMMSSSAASEGSIGYEAGTPAATEGAAAMPEAARSSGGGLSKRRGSYGTFDTSSATASTAAASAVKAATQHLLTSLLLRCPACGIAFDDAYDGCDSISCDCCGAWFCGLCGVAADEEREIHCHVRTDHKRSLVYSDMSDRAPLHHQWRLRSITDAITCMAERQGVHAESVLRALEGAGAAIGRQGISWSELWGGLSLELQTALLLTSATPVDNPVSYSPTAAAVDSEGNSGASASLIEAAQLAVASGYSERIVATIPSENNAQQSALRAVAVDGRGAAGIRVPFERINVAGAVAGAAFQQRVRRANGIINTRLPAQVNQQLTDDAAVALA